MDESRRFSISQSDVATPPLSVLGLSILRSEQEDDDDEDEQEEEELILRRTHQLKREDSRKAIIQPHTATSAVSGSSVKEKGAKDKEREKDHKTKDKSTSRHKTRRQRSLSDSFEKTLRNTSANTMASTTDRGGGGVTDNKRQAKSQRHHRERARSRAVLRSSDAEDSSISLLIHHHHTNQYGGEDLPNVGDSLVSIVSEHRRPALGASLELFLTKSSTPPLPTAELLIAKSDNTGPLFDLPPVRGASPVDHLEASGASTILPSPSLTLLPSMEDFTAIASPAVAIDHLPIPQVAAVEFYSDELSTATLWRSVLSHLTTNLPASTSIARSPEVFPHQVRQSPSHFQHPHSYLPFVLFTDRRQTFGASVA